ncbi:unnamed protein product [Effrenium voratum]|nr:unnamed protein product [Effrenium voratum]
MAGDAPSAQAAAEQLLNSIRRLQACSAVVQSSLVELKQLSAAERRQDLADLEFTCLAAMAPDCPAEIAKSDRRPRDPPGASDSKVEEDEEQDARRSARQARRGRLPKLGTIEEEEASGESEASDLDAGAGSDSDSSADRLWASVQEVDLPG